MNGSADCLFPSCHGLDDSLYLLAAGGDALATQNWLDTAGGQRSKPQNVWTQKQPERPSQWADGNLIQKDRAVKDAWAKK